MPVIDFDDRPISITEGSRGVRLPHGTGISLTTREHENECKRASMSDLMAEANSIILDVEVITEINTHASFETVAEDVDTHVNRVNQTVRRGLALPRPA